MIKTLSVTAILLPLCTESAIAQGRPTSIWGASEPLYPELTFNTFSYDDEKPLLEGLLTLNDNHGLVGVVSATQDHEYNQFSGGIRIFPAKDYLEIKPAVIVKDYEDSTQLGYGLYFTLRNGVFDKDFLAYTKLRVGLEHNEFHDVNWASFVNLRQRFMLPGNNYLDKLELLSFVSRRQERGDKETISGVGGIAYFPMNMYVMYGHSFSENDLDMVGFGMYAPMHGEASDINGFYMKKSGEYYDFQFAGLTLGESELVSPALIGMTEGTFYSSGGLVENRKMRRFEQLGQFSKDWEIGDVVLLYAGQDIIIPVFGTELHQGFNSIVGYATILENLGPFSDIYVKGGQDWVTEAIFNPRAPESEETQFTTSGLGFKVSTFGKILGVELTGEVQEGKFNAFNANLYMGF